MARRGRAVRQAGSTRKPPAARVYMEVGSRRQFASAIDWPGWCRAGRDEPAALAALAAAAPRYAPVARAAGVVFSAADAERLEVVERVEGSTTTDFGAPGAQASSDSRQLAPGEAERLIALLEAAWKFFDRVVAGAPAELRKGPRGGGRDRDEVCDHVLGAEAMYARKVGVRLGQPARNDLAAIAAFRVAFVQGLLGAAEKPPAEKAWPFRYAVRRVAWHVLDHAWEIQDRS